VTLAAARAALLGYEPEAPRERAFRERMLALLDGPAPLSRLSFEPGHLTASAFVLSPEGDAVLLILHKKLKIWVQPGGHVEAGDGDLEAAARREVEEEVGIELEPRRSSVFDLDIHQIPARPHEPAHEHFDVRFCLRALSRAYVTNEEVVDARWVPLRELEALTRDESVLRAAGKLTR
jgi:8-oxo-dGTP pyrophosphatase MutT (NUDIX family)